MSNDPGGDRWTRHLNRLVDLYVDDAMTGGARADDAQPDQATRGPRARRRGVRPLRRRWWRRSRRDEWARPTDCTGWDVRKMALHVLGSADAQASFREFVHQLRRGVPLNKQIDSHHWVDGMNELQIRERAHLSERRDRRAAHGPSARRR